MPDVLYHQEMQSEWGARLVELGLRVEEVSKEGVSNALRYRAQRRVLSVPDSFALALAKERAWSLLTGDNQLRDLAAGEDVECHGVLWLLDRMEEAGIPALQALHNGLAVLAGGTKFKKHSREGAKLPVWRSPLFRLCLETAAAISGVDLVLRLCSVKNRAKAQSENWVFSIARKRCWKRNVLCFQFTVVFPSWTSRVRVPSPAPCFQQLRKPHRFLVTPFTPLTPATSR